MKSLKKYLITLGVSLLFVFLIALLRDVFNQNDVQKVYHILSDSFFVVGVIVTGMGLLVFASNEGTFDMIIYGVSTFINLFRPHAQKKYDTFYDYRISKSQNKINSWFLLIIGVFLILMAVLMLLIYKKFD